MPTPIERQSLTTTLEERYRDQPCGGSFDAKSIKTSEGSRMPITDASGIGPSITEALWTVPNFAVKLPLLQTELKDAIDGQTSKELSSLIKGFSNKKYKP